MPMFLCGDAHVYFAHCPKAGGSSIETFAERCFGTVEFVDRRWHAAWARHGLSARTGRSSPQHATWDSIRPALRNDPDHIFTVVRDPVARLLSEYRYQRSNPKLYPWLSRWMRFAGFPLWLETMIAAARHCPEICDNHFVPQVRFIPEDGVRVFKLEHGLDDVVDYLGGISRNRIAMPVPHELGAGRIPLPRPTRQNVELIFETYGEDYRRFGYETPDFQAYPHDPAAPLRSRLARAAAGSVARRYRDGRL